MANKICVRCGMEYPNHKMSCKIPVEEWRLPTAEEFRKDFMSKRTRTGALSYTEELEYLKEFAKLHCEAQLKAILENAKVKKTVTSGGIRSIKHVVDKDSILNAYPLDQIK